MARFGFQGIWVEYEILGGNVANDPHAGEGPPVLFLHGLGANRDQARAALANIPELPVIILDLPGHGQTHLSPTKPIDDQVGFAPYAQLVRALLDHLGIETVTAGGISMGAGVAVSLALLEPRLVDRLFLIRPGWLTKCSPPHLDVLAQIDDIVALRERDGEEPAVDRLQGLPAFRKLLAGSAGAARTVSDIAHRAMNGHTAMIFRRLVNDRPVNRMSDLAQITCPSLVLGNSGDPLHPQDLALTLAAGLLQGRYAHIPPRYEEPDSHRVATEMHARSFMLPGDVTRFLRRA